MSPAVYYNFQEVVNFYCSKYFFDDEYVILSESSEIFDYMSISDAKNDTFKIMNKKTGHFLYLGEYCDIMNKWNSEKENNDDF